MVWACTSFLRCRTCSLLPLSASAAMGRDAEELARLRQLLHNEPHVRGLGYNQYADEITDFEHMADYPDDEVAEDQG